MRIEAAEHRLYWKVLAVGVLVDLIGAAILAWGLEKLGGANDDTFLLTVGYLWLALQIARFIIMFLDIGRLWMAKELGAFKASGDVFFTAVKTNDLPKPEAYTYSVDSYLSNIADDEAQSPKARTVAACLYGVRQGTRNLGIFHSIFLDNAHEEALKRYADS